MDIFTTKCGFVAPGGEFWHRAAAAAAAADCVEQVGSEKEVAPSPNQLAPEFGYAAVPSIIQTAHVTLRKHYPSMESDAHARAIVQFKYRYVSIEHIVNYLKEMRNLTRADARVDFNQWLSTGSHAKEFALPSTGSTGVKALFRGIVDNKFLTERGVKFTDGVFLNVDFSYSTFRNITFGRVQQTRLIGCTFMDCTATGRAFSGSDLSLSIFDRCDFKGLTGALTLNHSVLSQTSFAGCALLVFDFHGMHCT